MPEPATLAWFDRRLRGAEGLGDPRVIGHALLDSGIVRFAYGMTEDAQRDLDRAGDTLEGAGDGVGAALAASAGSLVARLSGDVHGAVARAQFARGWAPPGSVGTVAAQLAIAEAALDAGDRVPGLWGYIEATNVLGEAALPEETRRRLAAYADWLNEGDNAASRPPTPRLSGIAAPPATAGRIAASFQGQVGVDDLAARTAPDETDETTVGHVASGLAAGVLALRAERLQAASQSFADAHLLGRTGPP